MLAPRKHVSAISVAASNDNVSVTSRKINQLAPPSSSHQRSMRRKSKNIEKKRHIPKKIDTRSIYRKWMFIANRHSMAAKEVLPKIIRKLREEKLQIEKWREIEEAKRARVRRKKEISLAIEEEAWRKYNQKWKRHINQHQNVAATERKIIIS